MKLYLVALKAKNDEYSEKPKTGYSNDKTLCELAWKVRELSDLNEEGRSLAVEARVLSDNIADRLYDTVGDSFSCKLSHFREQLLSFVKLVTRFRRTAATHILIVMISTEDRRSKPYALPIQLLPYVGIQDMEARALINKVIQEMVNRGTKVSGMWML